MPARMTRATERSEVRSVPFGVLHVNFATSLTDAPDHIYCITRTYHQEDIACEAVPALKAAGHTLASW